MDEVSSEAWTDVEECIELARPDVVVLDIMGNDLAALSDDRTPAWVAEKFD